VRAAIPLPLSASMHYSRPMNQAVRLDPEADHRFLKGAPIAAGILSEVAAAVVRARENGFPPRLVSITVGETAAVDVYVRNQRAKAASVGIEFEERRFPADITARELEAAIHGMNADPRVTGIIVQRPLPPGVPVKAMQSAIHPLKDVEGMHPASIGNIVYNELDLAPCTAAASVEMLKSTGLELKGLEAVVVGHSEIVGKPIAFLLMSEGATVTVCHHMTRSVAAHARRADALFVAVGRPRFIRADMVKPGAAVIDIGINSETGPDGVSRVVGDVDAESVREVASWITPVPGGVGPVTVSILMRNTMVALKRQQQLYAASYAPRLT
jgi:methylenetetrahydrofolate dehydrogenase (NADP+) / methenyltetrahydrofolate cyclohydrolase